MFFKKRIPDYDSPDPRVSRSAQQVVPVQYQEELYDEAVGLVPVHFESEQNEIKDQHTQPADANFALITTQLESVHTKDDTTNQVNQQMGREVSNDVKHSENSKVITQQEAENSSTHDGAGNRQEVQVASPKCTINEALNFGPSLSSFTQKTNEAAEKSRFSRITTDQNTSKLHSTNVAGRDGPQGNRFQFADDNSIAQVALNFIPSQSIHQQDGDEENLNQEAQNHEGNVEKQSLAGESNVEADPEEVLNVLQPQSESLTDETDEAASLNQNTSEDSDSSNGFTRDFSRLDIDDQIKDEITSDHEDQDNSMKVPDFGD